MRPANQQAFPGSARREASPIPRFPPRHRLFGLAGIFAIAGVVFAAPTNAPWHEGFEGPDPSWRPAAADLEYRLDIHGRVRGGAHTGHSSEQLRVTGTNGSYIDFSHPVPPSRISPELGVSVWLKSDRSGLQVLARVVLPGMIDPRTRQPTSIFIRGTSYAQVGIWERLHVDNFPLEVERQLRVLRWQLGHDVDARGAYLDQVWLNVYGGPGTTNVAIDDLEVVGIVEPIAESTTGARPASGQPSTGAPQFEGAAPWTAGPRAMPISQDISRTDPTVAPRAAAARTWAGTASGQRPPAHDVRLDGSVLIVDGHPFFPRILQYHGEPLELVVKTGFNAIRLTQPPPPQLLADAARAGIWIVCPPPMNGVIARARVRFRFSLASRRRLDDPGSADRD